MHAIYSKPSVAASLGGIKKIVFGWTEILWEHPIVVFIQAE